jgi:hypothetical protein
LIVLMSCLLTDLLRYVMIVSIPDTINHQGLERKLILKKNCAEVVNLKFKRLLPVNGYRYCKHISTPKSSRKVVISFCQSKI